MIPVQEQFSPDGRFKLILRSIDNGEGRWAYLGVDVIRVADGTLIGQTSRNLGNPHVFHFVQQDGKDYLVLSENYHGGYGVMDLEMVEQAVFDPETQEGVNEGEQFWCWAGPFSHDPEKKELVIVGCYWACPYERITFDFSNPMKPPYAILKVEEDEED